MGLFDIFSTLKDRKKRLESAARSVSGTRKPPKTTRPSVKTKPRKPIKRKPLNADASKPKGSMNVKEGAFHKILMGKSKEELVKAGYVKVEGYTRKDGVKVKTYFRSIW